MLGPSKPSSIPTFVMLEVGFHPRPPILLIGVGCFHPPRTLLAWQSAMMRFEFLKARQLLLHKLKHKELSVGILYYIWYVQMTSYNFLASLSWI